MKPIPAGAPVCKTCGKRAAGCFCPCPLCGKRTDTPPDDEASCQCCYEDLALALAAAKEGLAEAAVDTKRLDWLAHSWPISEIDCWWAAPGYLELEIDPMGRDLRYEGADLRDAIDAAMLAATPEAPK